MKIHIVEPYHSAAMQRMSEPLAELGKLYEVTTGEEIDDEADLNIHIPWHSLAGKDRGKSKHIVAYTHCNPNARAQLLDACDKADIVTAMSYEGRRELLKFGVDPRKVWTIYAGASDFQFRRRLIAIVGYPQPNGRKREHILLDLAWKYDLRLYEFVFVGKGWENFANELASLGVAVQAFHADTWDAINTLYGRVDALLVTGYVEGGPLPLLEAMAAGCKVFSPRFGYAADLLNDDDLYDGPDGLMEKLSDYFQPRIHNAMIARSWSWQDYAAEYALLAGRLLGESVDLYPERGAGRYAQLLDVIDEIQPKIIVEIGTWSGNSALRMIQQAAKYNPVEEIIYQGFDIFEKQTEADFRNELSKHGWHQDIVQRRLSATGAGVMLVGGYTRDTLEQNLISADLFFVDGGHSEGTIQYDGEQVLARMESNENAIAIFDDYYHEGQPEGFGCNKFIDSLKGYRVEFLPEHTQASDGRVVGMVRVQRVNKRAQGGLVDREKIYSIGEVNADVSLQRRETSTGSYIDYRASVSGVPG